MQDTNSYPKNIDPIEFEKEIQSLRASLKDIEEGRTQSVDTVFNELLDQDETQS
jgi:hypothetical protein